MIINFNSCFLVLILVPSHSQKMLRVNPKERITVNDALNHHYYRDVVSVPYVLLAAQEGAFVYSFETHLQLLYHCCFFVATN